MPGSIRGINPSHSPIKSRGTVRPNNLSFANKIDYYNKKQRKTTFNKNVHSIRKVENSFRSSFNTPLQFGRKFNKQSFVNLGSNRILGNSQRVVPNLNRQSHNFQQSMDMDFAGSNFFTPGQLRMMNGRHNNNMRNSVKPELNGSSNQFRISLKKNEQSFDNGRIRNN